MLGAGWNRYCKRIVAETRFSTASRNHVIDAADGIAESDHVVPAGHLRVR